jgi:hypothetical protein
VSPWRSLIAHVNALVGCARRAQGSLRGRLDGRRMLALDGRIGRSGVRGRAHAPHSRERPNPRQASRRGRIRKDVKGVRLRGSGGFRAVAEWRVGFPHGVKDDGELAGDGNLRPLEPRCLGKPQPLSLQPREPNTSRQDDVGSLKEVCAGHPIAAFRDVTIATDLAGFVASRCQSKVRARARRSGEAGRGRRRPRRRTRL